jgi:DNA (cytosine-5)-methyltransferase 1
MNSSTRRANLRLANSLYEGVYSQGFGSMKHNTLAGMEAQSKKKISAVDLFCGAGGLTHGLVRAGIDVRLGVDIDPACEYPYTSNNNAEFLLQPVEDLDADILQSYYGKEEIKLLAGCAPCQTFSTYNRNADDSDKRWWLLLQFSRLINDLLPDVITMENVPQLVSQHVFKDFVADLIRNEYFVSYQIVNSAEYGVPQQRKRLVLLASKLGPISLLTSKELGIKPKSVRDTLSALPALEAGARYSGDPLHCSSKLSEINMRRIRASRPGGTWRDWPQELLARCHAKESGKTYPSVYGRMTWDEPAPTITTQFFGFGNGRFGHPEQDRALSLREGAMLQSFPLEYSFVRTGEKIYHRTLGRLIGNAVPVALGEAIGNSIQSHVIQCSRRSHTSNDVRINHPNR